MRFFPKRCKTQEEFRDSPGSESAAAREHDGVRQESALSFQELAELGYRMVIFPQSAFRVSMKASGEFLRDLKKTGTQSGWIDKMQTRKELYELLDYDPTAESWKGGCLNRQTLDPESS